MFLILYLGTVSYEPRLTYTQSMLTLGAIVLASQQSNQSLLTLGALSLPVNSLLEGLLDLRIFLGEMVVVEGQERSYCLAQLWGLYILPRYLYMFGPICTYLYYHKRVKNKERVRVIP